MAGVCITLQKDTGKFSLFGGGGKGVKVVPLWYVFIEQRVYFICARVFYMLHAFIEYMICDIIL